MAGKLPMTKAGDSVRLYLCHSVCAGIKSQVGESMSIKQKRKMWQLYLHVIIVWHNETSGNEQ